MPVVAKYQSRKIHRAYASREHYASTPSWDGVKKILHKGYWYGRYDQFTLYEVFKQAQLDKNSEVLAYLC